MQVDQSAKCAHAPCQCLAGSGSAWCSTHCEDAAAGDRRAAGAGCGCGHPGCTSADEVPASAIGAG